MIDDAAHNLALAVELYESSSHVGSQPHRRDLAQQNRRAVVAHGHRNLLNVAHILDVASPANDVFNPGEFHDTAAHVVIALANCFHNEGIERR